MYESSSLSRNNLPMSALLSPAFFPSPYPRFSRRWIADRLSTCKIVLVELKNGFFRAVLIDKGLNRYEMVRESVLTDITFSHTMGDEDKERFTTWLKEFFADIPPAERWTAFLLPRRFVSMKKVDIPATDYQRVQQMLQYEIDRHIPFDVDQVVYDFQILSPHSIQLVTCQRVVTEGLYSLVLPITGSLEYIGVAGVGVDALFTQGADKKTEEDVYRLVVELSLDDIDFSFYRDNVLLLSRRAAFDTPLWRETVVHGSSCSEELLSEMHTLLQKEYRQSLTFFQNQHHGDVEHTLYFSSLRFTKELKDKWQEEKSETILSFPLSTTAPLLADPGSYASLLGAGLLVVRQNHEHALNLLPVPMRTKRSNANLALFGVILTAFLLFLVVQFFTGYSRDNENLEQIKSEVKKYKKEAMLVEDLQYKIETISNDMKAFNEELSSDFSKTELIEELTSLLPDSVWLSGLDITGDMVRLKGYADNSAHLIELLETSSLLEDVHFEGSVSRDKGTGKEHFRILAKVKGKTS